MVHGEARLGRGAFASAAVRSEACGRTAAFLSEPRLRAALTAATPL